MRKINIKSNCPNCGAPITTEVCPYCHAATGLDTKYADMEYPVIECKEAKIGFWNVAFPLIFAFGFGAGGIIPLVMSFIFNEIESMAGESIGISPFLFTGIFSLIFLPISIVFFVIVLKNISRFCILKKYGKEIDATVYGYMDDNLLLNGNPAQIVKLLVTTNEGPRFILYQLGDIKKPFKVNSKIKLKVYKDIFLIENKKKYYFE